MSGIESALKESLPRSHLYVFTDASAKDYGKYAEIKSLAQKKSSKVIFVLTGRCQFGSKQPDEVVYYDLATATSGQVFHLGKSDVGEILKYVIESIKATTTVLHSKTYPPGYGHEINVTADEHIRDVIISASGVKPKIEDVTDPEGGKPDTEDITDLDEVVVIKVPDAKPGVYTAKVGSKSDTTVVITGTTTIDFQHGFSTFKPASIKDTATRPQPEVNSYLSIKLNIIGGGDVKLTHVKLVDLEGKPILEEPLEILDEKDRFYVTEPIITPKEMFRVMVIGYNVADKSTITRTSPTPIEPQKPELEKKEPRAPKITIEGDKKVVDYNAPVKLSCRVNAYPKPDVIWLEESSGSTLPSTVADVEPPYEYVNILDIEKVNKNSTYTCKASNVHGVDIKNIAVEIPSYFIVMESPKDAVIKYNTTGIFLCKIDASPPAKITWYRNGKELGTDERIVISPDGSVLAIPHMDPYLQGHYTCDASNVLKRETFKFNVAISGVEAPKIDKSIDEVHVAKGSDVKLICRVTEGIPLPRYIWHYKGNSHERFKKIRGIYGNKVQLRDVTVLNSGLYKCMVFNPIGHDVHDIKLVVEYPPKIKESENNVSGNVGEEITLTCEVDSVPEARVTWTKNGEIIKNTPKTPIYRDNSLKLKLSIEDNGIYKCTASNRLGNATKEVSLTVYVPAHIEPPKESPVNIKVGEDIKLPCIADGVPKPEINWVIHDKDGKTVTKVTSVAEFPDFFWPRAQLEHSGYYTCIATNAGGSYNITYDLNVNAPPNIENEYKDKTFRPVEGDMVLMIKCRATGHPKPVITWKKDGKNIASGTPWYDIDEQGTLLIKNVDMESSGTYVCQADNILGRDSELFYVAADPYPLDAKPTSTLRVEKGSSAKVECNVPHGFIDWVRWYKDRKLLLNGDLIIDDAKLSDSGLYVCRVSNLANSYSGYTKVNVGFKPKFVSDEDENVEIVDGYLAELICTNEAEPPAKMTWKHNGNLLNISRQEHFFYMARSDHGNYTCEASNEFGTIHRTFYMISPDCVLSIKDDFTDNQPIMFTSPLNWPSYEISADSMIIPRDDYVSLLCPGDFTIFPSPYVMAFCEGEKKFKVKGKTYKYTDIKCKKEFEPNIYETGGECHGDDTELLNIQYEVLDGILQAYDVCYDKYNNMPVYTKHRLDRHMADVEPKNKKWLNTHLWPLNSDNLYDCRNEISKISIDIRSWFHVDDKCCFSRRQLINPRDMIPGLMQSSTYTYLNVVPHWSTCITNNWDDLEQKLRNLVKSIDYSLTVWTGVSKRAQLKSKGSIAKTDIILEDGKGKSQSVPKYLWKVIQDPVTRSSLAVIQVNVPDLKSSEISEYVLCEDICEHIPWFRGSQWHNVSQGFTYCCRIRDFEKAFGFERVFNRGYDRVLTKVSHLSSDSLLT
ncbi:hypothetical protein O3G_MSEX008521 [Manduca sexta]|uniref:Hemolin n=1 Tax=Manduca sexta TaxID=7130 RepID=A0A921ZBZ4_MANSE|nr:hypothetical protein O3G_MSEX008521 [Manduca sexta]